MSRSRHHEWKNDNRPKKWMPFTARIIWFEEGDGQNIRLSLEDCERQINVYPKSKEEADRIWFMFRQGAPVPGERKPFVYDIERGR